MIPWRRRKRLSFPPSGMVAIETFSNSVPVIVGDIGNIGALVCDGVTGKTFRYDSPDSLIVTIREEDGWECTEAKCSAVLCR